MPLVTGTRWRRRSPTVSRVRRESPVVQHRLPLRHPLHGTVCLALKASRDFRPRRLSRAVAGLRRPFPALLPSNSWQIQSNYEPPRSGTVCAFREGRGG
jgi:hypothetical protein